MKRLLSHRVKNPEILLVRKLSMLIFLFCGILFTSYSQVNIQFIQNKTQWNKNVKYRADIASGAIFLEKNCFTYSFYNFDEVHDCQHSPETEEDAHHKPCANSIVHFHAIKMQFRNSNESVALNGRNEFSHYYNYFIGNDKKKWSSNVKCYDGINYKDLYKNIDLEMYQTEYNLKYDIIVNPGGNPDDIIIDFKGASKVFLQDGNLVISTTVNNILEKKPYAYQEINGTKKEVKCKFVLDDNQLSFKLGNYNIEYPLVIDPVLTFSSYSGSYSNNFGYTATYDSQGHLYSGSTAFGPDYPTTIGAYQTTYGGDSDMTNESHGTDIAITKWSPDGTSLIYSTLLGGNMDELPHSIFVNSKFELYLYGTTGSDNFPVTSNAFDQTFNGGDPFNPAGLGVGFPTGTDIIAVKLNADGTDLLGSTYIGGGANDGINTGTLKYNYADEVRGEIFVDEALNPYIVSSTFSTDFPVTAGAFQSTHSGGLDGCVLKLSYDLSSITWSSYIGGSQTDAAYSIALDSNDDIYISGGTTSTDFPTTPGVLYPSYIGGLADAFVTKIANDGQSIQASGFFGSTEYDQAYFVELNHWDEVYLYGQTLASASTLIQNATYGNPGSGQFISVLDSSLTSIIRSTVFGTGNGVNISPTAFLVDLCNKIYISGWGGQTNQYYGNGGWTTGMDVTSDAFQPTTDGSDFYLAVFEDDLSDIHYGTFMGGDQSQEHVDGGTSRFSEKGKIYEAVCAGCNYTAGVPPGNSDFPTTSGVWSNTNNHYCNLAVFKFDFMLPITIAEFTLPMHVCLPYSHDFDNLSQYADSYEWNFGDSTYSTAFEPGHVFDSVGTFYVSLLASSDSSCNFADSVVHVITVHNLAAQTPEDTVICEGENITLSATSNDPFATYIFSSNGNFTDTLNTNINVGSLTVSPATGTSYYIAINGEFCDYIDTTFVDVKKADITPGPDEIMCLSEGIDIYVTNQIPGDNLSYTWAPSGSIVSGGNTESPNVNPTSNTVYSVTVTNQYGCSSTESILVEVDDVQYTASSQNLTCYNECNGSISISPTLGISPYSYQWSNSDNTATINNLCIGTYSLTITDDLGCSATYSTNIDQPPLLEVAIADIQGTMCNGGCSGLIEVTASGGVPPYDYSWVDGQSTNIASGLCGGTYTVTVTDGNGCDTITGADISDPSDLTTSTAIVTSLLCYGDCNGAASVTTSQGNPPYIYSWSTGGLSSLEQNLCSGSYSVTTIDSDSCVRVNFITIPQPSPLSSNISSPGIACTGNSTSAYISANGGTGQITYLWEDSGGQFISDNQTITDIYPGSYFVTATDANGCSVTDEITISEPQPLTYSTTISELTCVDACDGVVTVFPEGGTPPYTIDWSNSNNGNTIEGLCTGDYAVTIIDGNDCQITGSMHVGVSDYSPELLVYADDTMLFSGESTNLHGTPGHAAYNWYPSSYLLYSNSSDPMATIGETTTFYLNIVDQYGCPANDSLVIYVTDIMCQEPYIYVPNAFTPNDDGKNDVLYVYSSMIDEIYFAIYNRWGELVFETDAINDGWDGTFEGRQVDPAVFVYYLQVTCYNQEKFFKKGNVTLIR